MKCNNCDYETDNKKSFSNHVRYGCSNEVKYTVLKCKYCDSFLPKRKPSEQGLFCNNKCYFLWGKGVLKGARKDRVIISKYYYVMRPDHNRSNKNGYVPEQIIVMENHLNRLLNENETVHHINLNSLDNNIENLQLMTKHEHLSYHAKQKHLKSKGQRWKREL